MANVKIDISVDTEKLLAEFPDGGEITDHSIVVVSDNQPDSVYETKFKDKLKTRCRDGLKIKWKISGLNKKDHLDFVKYEGDKDTLSVFNKKPEVNGSVKSECHGELKSGMKKTIITEYFISFCLKKNPGIVWRWDPKVETPFPPV